MSDTQATLQATAQDFEQLLEQSALSNPGSDPAWIHSDVYLAVEEDRVETIIAAGGGSVLTYCTFEDSYFESIDGSAEAIIDVERTLERLKVASDGGRMRFELVGPDDGLAEQLRAEGALQMAVTLPASDKALDRVPAELPERFNDSEAFLSPSNNPHQTVIDTTAEQVAKIVEAVELEDSTEYFYVTVEDGEFVLDVGDDLNYLRGDLVASNVDGPDLRNRYGPGFEAAFKHTLSGGVQLQTTPADDGGTPLAVVQVENNRTLRHVLSEVPNP